ncbi:hypothetical protein SynBIOSE41_04000 [Synechococcus sp. BIOS-E4-1]|nr:hypothetical protein SynBIOSE41_04000 [Synechococcus sp. BIOS-E4-1]
MRISCRLTIDSSLISLTGNHNLHAAYGHKAVSFLTKKTNFLTLISFDSHSKIPGQGIDL